MVGQATSPEIFDLDDIVERFEDQMADAGDARIEEHLPAPGHPAYLGVLGELIRVDLEHRWNRGHPVALGEYARRFPEAFSQPAFVAPLAFEEFRVRRAAGQSVSRAEYQREYHVDVSGWPTDDSTRSSGLIPAIDLPPEEGSPEDLSGEPLAESEQFFAPATGESVSQSVSIGGVAARPGATPSGSGLPAGRAPSQSRSQSALQERALRELSSLQPGAHFLGFDLVAELGRGAVGRVYLARQRHLANRRVVLKVTTEPTVEPDRLASLQHTNVVPIYSFHRSGGLHVVCMPYLGACVLKQWVDHLRQHPGVPRDQSRFVTTLAKLSGSTIPQVPRERPVAQSGPAAAFEEPVEELPESGVFRLRGENYPAAVLWLGARLAEGLAHAHEKGVLHLDIKPGNILLTDFGQPMLLDFHLARSSRAGSPGSRQIGGTIPYMGPEHLRCLVDEADVDPRADIYSLGVVLFEMLTGQLPFPAQHGGLGQILPKLIADRNVVPSVRALNSQVTPATEALVQRCLHPDPNQRYQSAEQLLEDLEAQLRHQPLRHAANPSLRERLTKWARRHPRVTSAGGISLIAASAMLLLISGLLARDYQVKRLEARQVADQFEAEAPIYKSALAMSVLTPEARARDIAQAELRLSEIGLLGRMTKAATPAETASQRLATDRDAARGVEFPAQPAPWAWQTQAPFSLLEGPQQTRLAKATSEVLFALAATELAEGQSLRAPGVIAPPALAHPGTAAPQAAAPGLASARAAGAPAVELNMSLDSGECRDSETLAARARQHWLHALSHNTRAIQYRPTGEVPAPLWKQRAKLLELLGQPGPADAARQLAAASTSAPADARPLTAIDLVTTARYVEASQLFAELCDKDPRDPSAWFLAGVGRWNLGQFADAEACFSAALALRPDWDRPWYYRAGSRIWQRRYREAISDCEQALLLSPGSSEALRNRSIARERLGDYPQALADLSQLIDSEHPETRLLRMRSLIYRKLEQPELAEADLRRFLETRPRDAASWNARGAVKLAQRDVEGALADFQAATAANPLDLDGYNNEATVLAESLNRTDEAVQALDRGLEICPQHAKMRAFRAVLLARQGKRDAALSDIQLALQSNRDPLYVYQAACVEALTLPEEQLANPETFKLLADAFSAQPNLATLAMGDHDLDRLKSLEGFTKLVAAGQVMGQAMKLIRP